MNRNFRTTMGAATRLSSPALCLFLGTTPILLGATLTRVPDTKVAFVHETINRRPSYAGNAFLRLKGNNSPSAAIEALDLQGNLVGLASIPITDARLIAVRAFSRGIDGTLAAGGWSQSYDGRTASYLAIMPGDGQAHTIVRTDSYGVRKLAVAADGTVWTVGNVLHREDRPPDADPKHGTVRHFDHSGKLIGSFFPYASLGDSLRDTIGFMGASRDRVGWISSGYASQGKDRLGAYVEFTAAGAVEEYPLPPTVQRRIDALYGLALTDDCGVFAQVLDEKGKEQIFRLNRSSRSWERVSPLGMPDGLRLAGGSGNTLALWPNNGDVYFYAVTN